MKIDEAMKELLLFCKQLRLVVVRNVKYGNKNPPNISSLDLKEKYLQKINFVGLDL